MPTNAGDVRAQYVAETKQHDTAVKAAAKIVADFGEVYEALDKSMMAAQGSARSASRAASVLAKSNARAAAAAEDLYDSTKKTGYALGMADQKATGLAGALGGLRTRTTRAGGALTGFRGKLDGLITAGVGAATVMGTLGLAVKAYNLASVAAQNKAAITTFEKMGGSVDDLSKATGHMISQADLIKKANFAQTMGISTKDFVFLTKVAQAAAIKTGQDFQFMFDSVITGAARASPVILDNLGLNIQLEEIYKRVAAASNRKTAELTAEEKQTILMNELHRQGADLIEQVGDVAATTAGAFARFEANLKNFAGSVQKLVLPVVGFWVDKMNDLFESFERLEKYEKESAALDATPQGRIIKRRDELKRARAELIAAEERGGQFQIGARRVETTPGLEGMEGKASREAIKDLTRRIAMLNRDLRRVVTAPKAPEPKAPARAPAPKPTAASRREKARARERAEREKQRLARSKRAADDVARATIDAHEKWADAAIKKYDDMGREIRKVNAEIVTAQRGTVKGQLTRTPRTPATGLLDDPLTASEHTARMRARQESEAEAITEFAGMMRDVAGGEFGTIGAALGTALGGPVGAAIGSEVGSMVGGILEAVPNMIEGAGRSLAIDQRLGDAIFAGGEGRKIRGVIASAFGPLGHAVNTATEPLIYLSDVAFSLITQTKAFDTAMKASEVAVDAALIKPLSKLVGDAGINAFPGLIEKFAAGFLPVAEAFAQPEIFSLVFEGMKFVGIGFLELFKITAHAANGIADVAAWAARLLQNHALADALDAFEINVGDVDSALADLRGLTFDAAVESGDRLAATLEKTNEAASVINAPRGLKIDAATFDASTAAEGGAGDGGGGGRNNGITNVYIENMRANDLASFTVAAQSAERLKRAAEDGRLSGPNIRSGLG